MSDNEEHLGASIGDSAEDLEQKDEALKEKLEDLKEKKTEIEAKAAEDIDKPGEEQEIGAMLDRYHTHDNELNAVQNKIDETKEDQEKVQDLKQAMENPGAGRNIGHKLE